MNVPKGYVKVPKDKLLSEYVKYIQGKRDNPLLHYAFSTRVTGFHSSVIPQSDSKCE